MSFTIIGTGSTAPSCVKDNNELSKIMDTTDEWISIRTGIKQRHICINETAADLAFEASVKALENAKITADELDLIICPTSRGDYIIPSLACIVQERLGACCPAFDINAACSGFVFALDIAAGYFARKGVKKILVVASETMSKLVDWKDRSTCVLFGDGVGAVVLAKGEDLLSIRLTSKGTAASLYIPHISGNCPFGGLNAKDTCMHMEGKEIYKFAVSSICNDLSYVINKAGLSEGDIKYVLSHQANMRIIDAAQSRMNIPRERFLTNIDNYGNTSSASIPILLDEANREGKFKKGDLLALTAFGAGLTTGACILRWNK
jgi:3-oxoacyl-[acyl-carrier-protein] synthase-3